MLNINSLNREKFHFLGLIILISGIPVSHFLMSIGQIILFVNWIFDKEILIKIRKFFCNKAALWFTVLFLMHIIGLIYTKDFNYAFKDLRTKLPILLLPLILASSNFILTEKEIKKLLYIYVFSVLFGTLVSIIYYFTNKINDIRNISVFISHIRFSLNICFSICILYFYLFVNQINNSKKENLLLFFTMIWFVIYLFILQSLTGISIFLVLIITILIYYINHFKKLLFKLTALTIFLTLLFTLIFVMKKSYDSYFKVEDINLNTLVQYTSNGNKYQHKIKDYGIENGRYIGLYICYEELKKEWEYRSKIKISDNDNKGQPIINTLIRFLNSKGLRKDAQGVKLLKETEIHAIENGCANEIYLKKWNINSILYKIFFEYNCYKISGSAKGHTLFQRFELWKAAFGIIKENIWYGVGTGDMVYEYENQLSKMNSDLKGQNLRAHNQYLSIFSCFGILGFIIFISILISPLFYKKKSLKFIFISFFIIISISMLTEDTIESQAGVTFFAFFYTFYLINVKQ